jgi:uncharacterized protein DUF4382
MRLLPSLILTGATVLLTAGAFACAGTDNPAAPSGSASGNAPAGPGAGASGSTGTLAIHLTDSPFSDASALLVTFSEVSVHRADPGAWSTLPFSPAATSRTCDLKQLQGATDVLGVGTQLAAGKYTQIRLSVASAFLYFTPNSGSIGGACVSNVTVPPGGVSVDIPSGEVKLNNEFTLTSAGTKIVLDFDGDQSVHQTGSGHGKGKGNTKYMMSPVIRVVSVE